MLSRSEDQKNRKTQRQNKFRKLFLKCINFVFKSYMYLGLTYFSAITVVSIIYKSYLHQEPPFDYQKYIHTDNELVVVLTTIISSFFFSGLIAVLTEPRKRPLPKKVEKKQERRVRRRKPHKAA